MGQTTRHCNVNKKRQGICHKRLLISESDLIFEKIIVSVGWAVQRPTYISKINYESYMC